jgi:uncharacterized membrane protein YuzA (DUF378 family)
MEPVVAAEHLQVIRTLMERSALYRRALAPIMICAGGIGLVAAITGYMLPISRGAVFVLYWYAVGLIAVAAALLLTRRQAWQQSEEFWSPPTRRVVQAMLPALSAGSLVGLVAVATEMLPAVYGERSGALPAELVFVGIPALWTILYGCAMHAAGFYATRGMRLFGWLLALAGCGLLFSAPLLRGNLLCVGHVMMGTFFGVSHLAYGVYLYFTESSRNEA